MLKAADYDPTLARILVLDEIYDLALYKALHRIAPDTLRGILEELIRVETNHVAFWQQFFDLPLTELDWSRRIKLALVVFSCRLFGPSAIHLVLEAIEVYGVRKYLSVWKAYYGKPLGEAVKGILIDEFKHEDAIVTQMGARRIDAESIRNIFLGLNDGLVEILGAVSGFFGAFGHSVTVLIAGSTTAVAGSLSMAAGAYVALSSEKEVQRTEEDRQRFLSGAPPTDDSAASGKPEPQTLSSALVVGGSYLAGAMIPLLPVAFGARSALASVLTAGSVIILVSTGLSFLSGMDIRKRILTNVVILATAVGVTYGIGLIAKRLWGIPL